MQKKTYVLIYTYTMINLGEYFVYCEVFQQNFKEPVRSLLVIESIILPVKTVMSFEGLECPFYISEKLR